MEWCEDAEESSESADAYSFPESALDDEARYP